MAEGDVNYASVVFKSDQPRNTTSAAAAGESASSGPCRCVRAPVQLVPGSFYSNRTFTMRSVKRSGVRVDQMNTPLCCDGSEYPHVDGDDLPS